VPDNPLPLACIALALAVPPLAAGARRVAAALSDDADVPPALAPGLALAAWLLAVHVVGLATGSFVRGLVGGTLLAASAGALAFRLLPAPAPRPRRALLEHLAPFLAALLIAPMALRWAFHDELLTTGHWALVSELQNGLYPPRYTTFPEIELRYHYGFDVLVAAVTAVTRVGPGLGIDLVTLALFAYAWRLLTVVGDRVAGRRFGSLAAALALFGGGMPLFCDKPLPFTVPVALGQCPVATAPPNPPVVSYVFQHAWGLGLPLALVAILLVVDERPLRPAARRLATALVLVALALAQIVLFCAVGAAILAHELAAGSSARARRGAVAITLRLSLRGALLAALVAVPTVLAATRLHGFFAPSPNAAPDLALRLGVVDGLGPALRWHAATFGVALPLGLAGLALARRGRLLLAALVVGSLLVVNVLRYCLSWDILKFATVGSIALALASAAALARLWAARPRSVAAPLAGALAACALLFGLAFPVVFALDLDGIPLGNFFRASPDVAPDDLRAIALLRRLAGRDDSVYRTPPAVWSYAPWGGLAHPWPDGQARVFFEPARFVERDALLEALPPDVDRWLAHRVRFLVLEPADVALRGHAARWVDAGRARLVARSGALDVVELLRAPRPAVDADRP
jgi:hypothetical protein